MLEMKKRANALPLRQVSEAPALHNKKGAIQPDRPNPSLYEGAIGNLKLLAGPTEVGHHRDEN